MFAAYVRFLDPALAEKSYPWLNDSKKLKRETITALASQIWEDENARFALAYVATKDVDKLGGGRARKALFSRVARDVADGGGSAHLLIDGSPIAPTRVLLANPDMASALVGVDGTRRTRTAKLMYEPLIEWVPKGDGIHLEIAAASVLAKNQQLLNMMLLHEDFPAYGFNEHAGYLTPKHIEVLRRIGACPAHRTSYLTDKVMKGTPP